MTAPFKYSGNISGYEKCERDVHEKLLDQTGIVLEPNCGIDTSFYAKDWHGVSIMTEIVCADFIEARQRRLPAQQSLFAEAA